MFYEFKLGHNTMEANKNICCIKEKTTINHSTLTRWFKKFCSDCMNPDDQLWSSRPKTMDLEAMPQVILTNSPNSTGRVSGDLGILLSNEDYHIPNLRKANCASCYQNILKLLTPAGIFLLESSLEFNNFI